MRGWPVIEQFYLEVPTMASKPKVNARMILRALAEVRRKGNQRTLEELEKSEPDLAEHLMEGASAVYHDLLELGAPAKQTQRLYQKIEALVLVCVMAARRDQ